VRDRSVAPSPRCRLVAHRVRSYKKRGVVLMYSPVE